MYVGIDPQPTLIAVHARNTTKTLYWKNLYLMKKVYFEGAQKWQEYIHQQSKELIIDLMNIAKKNNCIIKLIIIEQQRGRVYSLIEQCLLDICIFYSLPRVIMHPVVWRRHVGLNNTHGNNKTNKINSVNIVKHQMKEEIPIEDKRIHDLCEAYLMSLVASKIGELNSKTIDINASSKFIETEQECETSTTVFSQR